MNLSVFTKKISWKFFDEIVEFRLEQIKIGEIQWFLRFHGPPTQAGEFLPHLQSKEKTFPLLDNSPSAQNKKISKSLTIEFQFSSCLQAYFSMHIAILL